MKYLRRETGLKITALMGALAVGLGAFGAHGLQDLLMEHGRIETWKTAGFYHLVHSVVLLVLVTRTNWKPMPWILILTGTLIFSGSLYLLCLTQVSLLGAITPIGGVCLIAGWIGLCFGDGKQG